MSLTADLTTKPRPEKGLKKQIVKDNELKATTQTEFQTKDYLAYKEALRKSKGPVNQSVSSNEAQPSKELVANGLDDMRLGRLTGPMPKTSKLRNEAQPSKELSANELNIIGSSEAIDLKLKEQSSWSNEAQPFKELSANGPINKRLTSALKAKQMQDKESSQLKQENEAQLHNELLANGSANNKQAPVNAAQSLKGLQADVASGGESIIKSDDNKYSLQAIQGSRAHISQVASQPSCGQIDNQKVNDKENRIKGKEPEKCRRIFRIGQVDIPSLTMSDSYNKPRGGGYIKAKLQIKSFGIANTFLCVDTGSDCTICTSQFIIHHFGEHALQKVKPQLVKPELTSATGQVLDLLGEIKMTIALGTYVFDYKVLVYNQDTAVFLLGNDCVYNRLIYNQGKSISFAEPGHEAIPIHYFSSFQYARTIGFQYIAPKSSALIPVKVSEPHGLPPQVIMINKITLGDRDSNPNFKGLIDSVSTVQSDGTALTWVENDTEDCLYLFPDQTIGQVNRVTDESDSLLFDGAKNEKTIEQLISKNPSSDNSNSQWHLDAVRALQEKFPEGIKVNWDSLSETSKQQLLDKPEAFQVNHIYDAKERGEFLDGLSTDFPDPTGHELSDLPSEPDNIEWIENVDRKHLSDEYWSLLKDTILRKAAAFSKHKYDIGCYNGFKVHLPLKPGTGYLYSKPRNLNAKHKEIAAEHVTELLKQGLIRPSRSPHATNVVIVSKKSGPGEPPKSRMCVDLRNVNLHSIPSRFPNLSLEDSLEKIQGAKFRSSFDFNQAFHQLVLDEDSIPVTAFYVNHVLYEYVRLPFGHVQAMQSFCSLMAILCHNYAPACYYADDLLITTRDDPRRSELDLFKQHLLDIEGMLDRIIEAGLKLSAHKCQWAYDSKRSMDWLGFTLSENLLKPQEAKIKAVSEYPRPTTAKQTISFVSLASFYRRFIKDFARIAQPLYDVGNLSKKEPFCWTPAAELAFVRLKEALCSDSVLRLPRQTEPFTVFTDASWTSLGCVLCQKDPIDGKLHPCAYGSRKFNSTEINYSTPLKELIAIIYALNLWTFYLANNHVTIMSDCRAWSFLKLQSPASGKISRMALAVQGDNIHITYIPGHKNKAADALSRAYDTGEVKHDEQLANKNPLLEQLGAPPIPEGCSIPKEKYLQLCQDYIDTKWSKIVLRSKLMELLDNYDPKVLNDTIDNLLSYTITPDHMVMNDNGSLIGRLKSSIIDQRTKDGNTALVKETISVNRIIENEFVGQFNNIPELNWPIQTKPDPDNISQGATDLDVPSMLGCCNSTPQLDEESIIQCSGQVNFLSIHNNVFTFDTFSELQLQDEFCLNKLIGLKNNVADIINAGYFIKKKILMRHMNTNDGQTYDVVCIPKAIVKSLLSSMHDNLISGHFGSQRFMLHVKRQYFWPGMKKDILQFHKQCIVCQANDKYPVKVKTGHMLKPKHPLDIVYIDIVVGLPKSTCGCYAMLMIYDSFTRFAQAIPLRSEKADYIVQQFMAQYVARYGMPKHIHSDNGRNMDASLIRHLCTMLGAKKTSTPPYHPASNPCECICGAIVQLIRKALTDSDQRYWPQCLPFVLNAYNSTVHTATGYTPNSLFLGRMDEPNSVPLVPFDSETANVSEYFQKLRRFQELSFEIVQHRNEKLSAARKVTADKNAITQPYKIGDYVMVKNLQPGLGPGQVKLRPKYLGPYRIIRVYESSVAVVPWSFNSKLEEFYRDPNLFRLAHRGDVKSFEVKITAIQNTKPYKGPIEVQQIIDPMKLNKFLADLDLDNQKILTFLPTDQNNDPVPDLISDSSGDSDDDDQPKRGLHSFTQNLDRPDDDSNYTQPSHITNPSSSATSMHTASRSVPSLDSSDLSAQNDMLDLNQLQENFDVDDEFMEQLENYREVRDDFNDVRHQLAGASKVIKMASGEDTKLRDLQQLMMSPDPAVRHSAGEALGKRLSLLTNPAIAKRIAFDVSSSESSNDSRASEALNSDKSDIIAKHEQAKIETRNLMKHCAKTIEKLSDKLNSPNVLSPEIRETVVDQLKKAKATFRKAQAKTLQLEGQIGETPKAASSPEGSLHTIDDEVASIHTTTDQSPNSKEDSDIQLEQDAASPELHIDDSLNATVIAQAQSPTQLNKASDDLSTPAIAIRRWLSNESPIPPTPGLDDGANKTLDWDDYDLHNIQATPVALPSQKLDVQTWLHNQPVVAPQIPNVSRAGRTLKKKVIFDPSDEIKREKELKASLKSHKTKLPSVAQPSSPDDGQQPSTSGIQMAKSIKTGSIPTARTDNKSNT